MGVGNGVTGMNRAGDMTVPGPAHQNVYLVAPADMPL